MPARDRQQIVRDAYRAYETGERRLIEDSLSEDFAFSAPPDPALDREGYFERCWPNRETIEEYDFVRMIEAGDEIVVTYELTKTDGSRFRNTEVFGFDADDRIRRVEVYFGWDVE